MTLFTNLVEGYQRFRGGNWKIQHERWSELAEGQSPKVMIISCSDSRVDPSQIFDCNPGEIFVVRNVAALVPPYETSAGYHGVSAALEFAVQFLKIEEIVVMGHGLCGGCKAALTRQMDGTGHGEGAFIANWIEMLDEAQAKVAAVHGTDGHIAERQMELEAVKVSLHNLQSFPFVRDKMASGALNLHGAYFAISDGVLHVLDEAQAEFAPAL